MLFVILFITLSYQKWIHFCVYVTQNHFQEKNPNYSLGKLLGSHVSFME